MIKSYIYDFDCRKFSPRCAACEKLIMPSNVSALIFFNCHVIVYLMLIILALFLDLVEIDNFSHFCYCARFFFQERGETVHIVSMQKNFHVECYKCEVIYLMGIIREHYKRSLLLAYTKLMSFRFMVIHRHIKYCCSKY